jgi:4-amino-4-deoxy-L-arabinose transferase-like glycosyltransferase
VAKNNTDKNSTLFWSKVAHAWNALGPWRHGLIYLALMLPFSVFRHVRIHGDEKVYVGQALEMLRAGHLWQQLQFGEVNYIKGPLHYLLLLLGHTLFGFSMTATVYMNIALAALAVVALRAAANHLFPNQKQWRSLPAWLFASSGAFVMFTYSSQMDSEVTSIYALVLALSVMAYKTGRLRFYSLVWLLTGLAGTLKSPLHSALLGLSVVTYFCLNKALWSELLGKQSRVAALVAGIAVCTSGYALPFLLDSTNWLDTYIYREQINRARFSDSGFMFLLNNFVLNLFPWSFFALAGLIALTSAAFKKRLVLSESLKVGLAFFLPTFIFFFGLGYRATWYGLPLCSSLWILILTPLLNTPEKLTATLSRCLLPFSALMCGLSVICHFIFFEGTTWWNWSNSVWIVGLFVTSIVFLELSLSSKKWMSAPAALILGATTFWSGALSLTATLGEAETADLRHIIKNKSNPIRYSNVNKENYNEWGYMAYMLGRPTDFANSFAELYEAAKNGEYLVFMTKQELTDFWNWTNTQGAAAGSVPATSLEVWRRWPRNARQMKEIWSERDTTENLWDRVARHYYVVHFPNHSRDVGATQSAAAEFLK